MSNEKKLSALVIGSTEYKNAEKCVEWGKHIYASDYDVIVVDTTTLTKDLLDQIVSNDSNYFSKLCKMMTEAQIRRNLRIVCIMSAFIDVEFSERTNSNYISSYYISNYSWSPVMPKFEELPGEKIDNNKTSNSLSYFKHIKCWQMLYGGKYDNNTQYKYDFRKTGKEVKAHLSKKVVNEINKAVAFELYWNVYKTNTIEINGGSILFIPPIKDTKKGIDILIKEYLYLEESRPKWVDNIALPQEDKILKKIEMIDNDISALEEKKKKELDKHRDIDKFRKLAYLNGKSLEPIVEDCFVLLGIQLATPDVDNIEDRTFVDDGCNIFIEIRGVNRGMRESDLRQLIHRVADKPIPQNYKTRGVFVFNHHNKKPLEEREEPFHHNIIKQAVGYHFCLITTQDILELVKIVLSGEKIVDFDKKLFNTIGKFDIDEFKKKV